MLKALNPKFLSIMCDTLLLAQGPLWNGGPSQRKGVEAFYDFSKSVLSAESSHSLKASDSSGTRAVRGFDRGYFAAQRPGVGAAMT